MRFSLAISEGSRDVYITLRLPGPGHILAIGRNLIMTAVTTDTNLHNYIYINCLVYLVSYTVI